MVLVRYGGPSSPVDTVGLAKLTADSIGHDEIACGTGVAGSAG